MTAQLISTRNHLHAGYSVRPISSRGVVGPDFLVVNVGRLASLPAPFVENVLHVDTADMVERFTLRTWVALRNDGSVFKSDTTKREVCRQVQDAYQS